MIITSPVYSLQISGQLKNFIDHMSYNFHRPKYFNKKALIITTTGGVRAKEIANYIKEVLTFWGINTTYKLPIVYRDNNLEKYELKSSFPGTVITFLFPLDYINKEECINKEIISLDDIIGGELW